MLVYLKTVSISKRTTLAVKNNIKCEAQDWSSCLQTWFDDRKATHIIFQSLMAGNYNSMSSLSQKNIPPLHLLMLLHEKKQTLHSILNRTAAANQKCKKKEVRPRAYGDCGLAATGESR
jgi:hypothetical protein